MSSHIQQKQILEKSIRNIIDEQVPFSLLKHACLQQYKKYKHLNMYITPITDFPLHKDNTTYIPYSIKDNFLTKGILTTAASKMLSNFESPYDATLVERLSKNNFINFGKANMDEFAMGSSGVSSYYGITQSLWQNQEGEYLSPGGSSSGSAVSVATGCVFVSICTDTSGSIRLPASHCSIVGFKPTYGVLSRHGIIPLAESLDHPGFLTRLVDDARYLFEKTIGKDINDLTSVDYKPITSHHKKFAILQEVYESNSVIQSHINEVEELFQSQGYEKEIHSVQELNAAIATYVILCRAECSSNMQRYDGLRFGFSQTGDNLDEQYIHTRSEGFGLEVQRRIMVGGFVTASENIQEYLHKAQQLRQLIKEKILHILQKVDFILMPTAMGAMTLKECENVNLQNPMEMQKRDLFTVVANLCGLPAVSIPVGYDDHQAPFGVDLMGQPFQDLQILDLGEMVEKRFNMQRKLINKITEGED